MKEYRADLHVHTVLSPCASVEMIPPLIIQAALDKNIDILAITDHNHTANIKAVQEAAEGSGIFVLPGMELQTREEIHVLCLFDSLKQASKLQNYVDQALPDIRNNPDFFGEQFIVDATGDFVQREDRLLINSTSITLKEAWEIVKELNGLLIPAHVDRQMFGLFPVLQFIPEDIQLEVLEISKFINPEQACQQFPQIKALPLFQNGDAHQLEDLLGSTVFSINSPSIHELQLAFHGSEGRSYRIGKG